MRYLKAFDGRMKTVYPRGLNKGLSLEFSKGYQLWMKTKKSEGAASQNVNTTAKMLTVGWDVHIV